MKQRFVSSYSLLDVQKAVVRLSMMALPVIRPGQHRLVYVASELHSTDIRKEIVTD
jgi:hypothetical protein